MLVNSYNCPFFVVKNLRWMLAEMIGQAGTNRYFHFLVGIYVP